MFNVRSVKNIKSTGPSLKGAVILFILHLKSQMKTSYRWNFKSLINNFLFVECGFRCKGGFVTLQILIKIKIL